MQALAAPTAGHSLIVARITLAEAIAAITRRERGGSIAPQNAATAVVDVYLDFARQYMIVEMTPGLIAQAARQARIHALRGYDAVQLAALLEAHAAVPLLTLLSSDLELNAAAAIEGLQVDDPSAHP